MHWKHREITLERLRQTVERSQQDLSKLLLEGILAKQLDSVEYYKAQSLLTARLNMSKKDLEAWLDIPRSF